MAIRIIPCSASPTIHFEVDDHLTISGWDTDEIQIKIRDENELNVRQAEDVVWIQAHVDCVASVPSASKITIGSANGSVSIQGISENISIENVGGHLALRQVGSVSCINVGGHLKINNVEGDLSAKNVGGSIRGGIVHGTLEIGNVGGAVKLMDVAVVGRMKVGGSIKMKLSALLDDLMAEAGGSIKLWLPEGTGYELEADSGGEKILLVNKNETERYSTFHQRMTIGGGGPLMQLSAGGSIMVMDAGWEEDLMPEDLGMSLGIDEDTINSRINTRVQERVQQAEMYARRAAERAEVRAREASRRAEERVRAATANIGREFPADEAWGSNPFSRTNPAPEPSKPTEEERVLILKMLSDKKITAEEACQLLDALDGKFKS